MTAPMTDTSPSVTEAEKLVERLRNLVQAMREEGVGHYDLCKTADEAADLIERLTLPVDDTELVERVDMVALGEIADDMDTAGHHWRANRIREATAALSIVRPHLSEIERLRAQLEEARGAAMEEAAKVAEDLVGPDHFSNDKMRNIGYRFAARAIRARISGRG